MNAPAKLKTKPAPKTSSEKFTDEFNTLKIAAVGVVCVRTREPFRCIDALRKYTFGKKMQFHLWKCNAGMMTYPVDSLETPPQNNVALQALPGALNWIGAQKVSLTPEGQERDTMYTILWPHDYVNKEQTMPDIRLNLAEFAKTFPETAKRVVIIVPPTYNLPVELEDSIPMLSMDTPWQAELRDTYDDLVKVAQEGKKEIPFKEEDIHRIISTGAGMTAMEFNNTISRGLMHFGDRWPKVDIQEFLQLLSTVKAEIIKRGEVLELVKVGTMEDIGGLDNLKEWIAERQRAFEPAAREFGVDMPKGCALFGVPGTGKSAAAKAIAFQLGTPLLKLDVGKIFNSLIGASEARLREALNMITLMAPVTVMIDEIDKAFSMSQSDGDSGVGKRVLGTLLTFMQENEAPVFWVVTGNRVENLPMELTRKGRLDEIFCVNVPNEEERLSIIKIHLRKRKKKVEDFDDLHLAVAASEGYVGSEIEAGVAAANLTAYNTKEELTGKLIAQTIAKSKPMSKTHPEDFNRMKSWGEVNAVPASSGEAPDTATAGTRRRAPALDTTAPARKRRFDSN